MSLSINQWTIKPASMPDAVAAVKANGLEAIGLWRQNVAAHGLAETAALARREGLRVSTLCRGGFLTAADPDARAAAIRDNEDAIREAVALGTQTVVLVVGGLLDGEKDLVATRRRVTENIAAIAPFAEAEGVKLAIEPLHPMFAADRAVVSTLDQALDIAEEVGSDHVGAVVDTYHVWWDPNLSAAIARAGRLGKLFSYQVCDWNLPLAAEPLHSRGYMGDGFIDFPTITRLVAATGYDDDIESEIFNEDIWAEPPAEAVATVKRRYDALVAPHL
ncbi:sugar phosphate isomerase/epimerase family protein [Propioniciclava soli]|uniref:sugar phosphate isomerase/epimerase family protein n=1 Tax=Propioniciclava soli TaxID=2775081 RepID=UPI001E4BA65D|nr:sugar phosphate isomerase/epimerase family protein [Propioniciclava soli]